MNSNFAFLNQSIPGLFPQANKAETFLRLDGASAAIYARITLENMVDYLYRVRQLPSPYGKAQPTLNDQLADPAFKALVNNQNLISKMHDVRKTGNSAAHGTRIKPTQATKTVIDLHLLLLWAARYHSTGAASINMKARFDPKLVPHIKGTQPETPKTGPELQALAKELEAERQHHREALEAKDAEIKAQAEQLAQLQAKLAHLFDETSPDNTRDYSEAETRKQLIDCELTEAGWDIHSPRMREVAIPNIPIRPDGSTGTGRADYVLWSPAGKPLAVVEAKRASRDPLEGLRQGEIYADGLFAQYGTYPVIIVTNGEEHQLWDKWSPGGDPAGYPAREILAFPTLDDLERMHQRRTARSLATAPIDKSIIDRSYQLSAVRAVGAAFESRRRRALLVMATGTGKTRVSMAIVKMLSDAGWVKNTLFLADRIYLVSQATSSYRHQFKDEMAVVNLLTDKDTAGRVFTATYPTIENMIAQRKFSPGFFDLIIVDEAHRSIYAKYGRIFEYFDALLVGLTATPKDDVDRDTYTLFGLSKGAPTDYYPLEQAVAENYLVPPRGISLTTKFLQEGISYRDLSEEEKAEWENTDWSDNPDDDGYMPAHVDAGALNKYLFNRGTVDHVLTELMGRGYRVENGNKLGKTIIFAQNQNHADYIKQRFDALFPQYGGLFARVITNRVERAHSLITEFADPQKMPQIAISVDMLDTGVDVPEVLNLVFFKRVHSYTKYWQMIGRGTRLCPDIFAPGQDKQDFLVFDCCNNIEYFNSDFDSPAGAVQESQAARTFKTSLALLTGLDASGAQWEEENRTLRPALVDSLHSFVASINRHSPFARKHTRTIAEYNEKSAWDGAVSSTSQEKLLGLADLDGTLAAGSPEALTFDLTVRLLQLDILQGNLAGAQARLDRIRAIAAKLADQLGANPAIDAHRGQVEFILSSAWGTEVPLTRLEAIRADLRGLIMLIPAGERKVFYTDFTDSAFETVEADIRTDIAGTVDVAEFERRIRHSLQEMFEVAAVRKAREGYRLTEADIAQLDAALMTAGEVTAEDVLQLRQTYQNLGAFLRSVVGMDRAAAARHMQKFLPKNASEPQIRMISMIVEGLTARGRVEPKDLGESPYSQGRPDLVFPEALADIVGTLRALDEGLPQDARL